MWNHSYYQCKASEEKVGDGGKKKALLLNYVIIGDHLIGEMWWEKIYRFKQKALEFSEMTYFQKLQLYDFKPNASTQLECGNF